MKTKPFRYLLKLFSWKKCILSKLLKNKIYITTFISLNKKIHGTWKNEWWDEIDTKLNEIKSHVNFRPDNSLNRRGEVVINRLRIDRTRLTHDYLMKWEKSPISVTCNCPLTVQHILIECRIYDQQHRMSERSHCPTVG